MRIDENVITLNLASPSNESCCHSMTSFIKNILANMSETLSSLDRNLIVYGSIQGISPVLVRQALTSAAKR